MIRKGRRHRLNLRAAIFKRHQGRCFWCRCRVGFTCPLPGKAFEPDAFTLDHIVTRMDGGPATRANLVASCRRCNELRGEMPASLWLAVVWGFLPALHRLTVDANRAKGESWQLAQADLRQMREGMTETSR